MYRGVSISFNFFIIGLIVVMIVAIFCSVIFKDEEKVDKGFELVYFKLSYRRKMIRTLWSLLIAVLSYYVIYGYGDLTTNQNLIIFIFFSIIFGVQLAYNYVKWKSVR